jgi:quercetin dioxygenase-like cupin family protein
MLWFLNALVTFPVAHDDGDDGISVMESYAPRGESAPYHVHRTEDEIFHLIEGEIVLLVDGATRRVRAGETHLAPKGVPHSYRVVSAHARWLITTANGDFERFVRDVSRPATRAELPEASGPPTAEQQAALLELAARHHIDLVGPPLSEEVAEAA